MNSARDPRLQEQYLGQLGIGEERRGEKEVSGFQSLLPPAFLPSPTTGARSLVGLLGENKGGERGNQIWGKENEKALCIHRVVG